MIPERKTLFALSGESISAYSPVTDAQSQGQIDLDLALMQTLLAKGTPQSFYIARRVYQEGAYSWPYAILTVPQGLPSTLEVGTNVTGYDSLSDPVAGFVYQKAGTGSKTLKVQYYELGGPRQCEVGANPKPDLRGCFAAKGTIKVDGTETVLKYRYDEKKDNKNDRTIQRFSTLATSKMKPCPNCKYFMDFASFVDYYNTPTYADEWIQAAFDGTYTNFRRGNADFSTYNVTARAQAIITCAAYMSTPMMCIRSMEAAFLQCQADGAAATDVALHLMDAAESFYSGSMVDSEGTGTGKKKGNLLFTLADDLCKDFKTCGKKGDSLTGTSRANFEIYQLFMEMQAAIQADNCPKLLIAKEIVEKKMFIPLIQATLKSAYLRDTHEVKDFQTEEAAGATFAASVLPEVSACSAADANIIYENMKTGATATNFTDVKAAFERRYPCLGITCEEVGGFYSNELGKYYNGANPCVTPPPEGENDVKEKLKTTLPWASIVFLLVCVSCYFYMRRRMRLRKERLKKYDQDNDLSDSDDEDEDKPMFA